MSSQDPPDNPICLALDARDRAEVNALADSTRAHVGAFKVGSTAFVSLGPPVVTGLLSTHPVFLDLKLHDIPAQVEGAAAAAADLGASYLSVHAAGGRDMVAAAVRGAGGALLVLAVTVLTSIDQPEAEELGMAGTVSERVVALAELALDAGASGLVCSALEARRLRDTFGPRGAGGPVIVVPGIRPRHGRKEDQRRTGQARAVLDAGADLIVVGRPITTAPDVGRAAAALADEIRS